MERPSWMHKNFRYPPSTPEAIEARLRCVPGPDWVPHLQEECRELKKEIARLRSSIESIMKKEQTQ